MKPYTPSRKSGHNMKYVILLYFLACPAFGGPDLNAIIEKAALKYKVDPQTMRAIAHVESSSGKYAVLRKNKNGTFDYGIFQINSIHWSTTCKIYDVTKPQGNAYCAARLLAQHKGAQDKDPMWQARFHSKTPSKKAAYYAKLMAYKSNLILAIKEK